MFRISSTQLLTKEYILSTIESSNDLLGPLKNTVRVTRKKIISTLFWESILKREKYYLYSIRYKIINQGKTPPPPFCYKIKNCRNDVKNPYDYKFDEVYEEFSVLYSLFKSGNMVFSLSGHLYDSELLLSDSKLFKDTKTADDGIQDSNLVTNNI